MSLSWIGWTLWESLHGFHVGLIKCFKKSPCVADQVAILCGVDWHYASIGMLTADLLSKGCRWQVGLQIGSDSKDDTLVLNRCQSWCECILHAFLRCTLCNIVPFMSLLPSLSHPWRGKYTYFVMMVSQVVHLCTGFSTWYNFCFMDNLSIFMFYKLLN